MKFTITNELNSDSFKEFVEAMCKSNYISSNRVEFLKIADLYVVVIITNRSKSGLDFETFNALDLMYGNFSRLGIKFSQQVSLFPNSDTIDSVSICFEKDDYDLLNEHLKNFYSSYSTKE